jgi:hypothetical protein
MFKDVSRPSHKATARHVTSVDMTNPGLDRHQKFGDIERGSWSAQMADVCGPFAPLFCVIGKCPLNLRGHFPGRTRDHA